MKTKTIAELEVDSNAAAEAHGAAVNRLHALNDAIKLLCAVDDLRTFDSALTDDDKTDLGEFAAFGVVLKYRAKIPTLKVEIDRLEDVSLAAQRALNDAPEEAA